MLPKETRTLFTAIHNSSDVTCDSARLSAELGGIAAFHEALLNDPQLSPEHAALFQQYVGQWAPDGGGHVMITAPESGVPEVHLKITAPASGAPSVTTNPVAGSIVCPHCHQTIVLKA
jgi:hypothetical protein